MFFVSVWCCLNGICVLMPIKTPFVYSFVFVLYLQSRPRDNMSVYCVYLLCIYKYKHMHVYI